MLPHQAPSEIVFPVSVASTQDPCVFRYDHGPVKLKAPRRRGRPLGSTKKPKPKESPTRASGDTQDGADYHFIHMAGGGSSSTNSKPGKISDETRATIRKHAMNNYVHRKRKTASEIKQPHALSPVHQINDVDPFDAFPVKLEPYMLDLLKYYMTTIWKEFYTIENYTSFNPMSDYCLTLAFGDSALMHLLIGCAGSYASRMGHMQEQAIPGTHMYRTLTIMKTRIATMQSVTDETIAVVATLAYVEKIKGSYNNWRIHMGGLKRLVDLRGGLHSLESKPIIMSKIFRADLCGSVDALEIPFFSCYYLPPPSSCATNSSQNKSPIATAGFRTLDRILMLDERIKHCVDCLDEASHLIASLMENRKDYAAAAKIRFLVTKSQYQLLSTEKYSHPMHELCRLVLLLFAESLVNPSPPHLPLCDLLLAKFRDLWKDSTDNNNDDNDDDNNNICCATINGQQFALPLDFKLWAMFVAASTVSAPNHALMEWYLRSIADIASLMTIGCMEVDTWRYGMMRKHSGVGAKSHVIYN
ncbi:hypothetical protein UA08_06014 [Talaromyces atroroseus]|uniref:Transcription factor domain-containing protein n=1 Tax=Talaromyces atroroseus TaxID=1441469 RepID=A0A225AGP6_TALAT|nr:hypothetical protein UA08_06014 [Talaromyces atroroseus]OKL58353.1 hypothetical protein UA08_06014 [Talaromyces atroroseus]